MTKIQDSKKEDDESKEEDENYKGLEIQLMERAAMTFRKVLKRKSLERYKEEEKRPKFSVPKNYAHWDRPLYEGED